MILAIDMGNSNIVVGGLDDNKTYFEERITTDDRKTSLADLFRREEDHRKETVSCWFRHEDRLKHQDG